MAVWTISAQCGTGGAEVARELAARADVPLLDRKSLLAFAIDLDLVPAVDNVEALEERVGGRLNALALSAAMSSGSPHAFRELQLRQTLPELGRAVLREAAREPVVIFAPAAFAALGDHPSAVHVRLRAPFEWRVAACQREEVVDRRCAEKTTHHDDDHQRAWVKKLYHVDVDDPRRFSLVVDVSQFRRHQVVELLFASG
jgi:cytidylate kinase